jgi:HEAT repeat protein
MVRDVVALDLSDTSKAQQQLDAMSADEVARYLTDPKDPQFSWAMAALRKKGEAAIPHLVKLMGRNDLGFFGGMSPTHALLDIGDKGLPPLIELLKGESPTARRNAAWALMKRNKPCKDAIAPLIEVLKGKDEEAAGYAAAALAPNSKDAADAVPHLIPLAFKLTKTHAPCLAVEAIGLDPCLIPNVIEQVAGASGEPASDAFRLWVCVGARLLAAAGKDGAAALAEALGHEKTTVRLAAAQAIQKLGKQAKTDAVEKALNAAIANDATRVDAAAALLAIGASAKAAVPGLIKDLESGQVELLASLTLRYMCRSAEVLALIPEAVPALIEGLGSDKEMVRIGCVWAMPTDTATAKQVVPKIKGLLARSTSPLEQELAVEKLYQLDPDWVRQAAGGDKGEIPWPLRPWCNVTRAVVAAAKAETKKAAE